MSTSDIVTVLGQAGVELKFVDGQLKAKLKKNCLISVEHRKLIEDNKAGLIAFLNPSPVEQNIGSQQLAANAQTEVAATDTNPTVTTEQLFYKEYTKADGKKVQFTREEFDQVVEAFRLLAVQDTKLRSKMAAA